MEEVPVRVDASITELERAWLCGRVDWQYGWGIVSNPYDEATQLELWKYYRKGWRDAGLGYVIFAL